jgi:hypothetical protein
MLSAGRHAVGEPRSVGWDGVRCAAETVQHTMGFGAETCARTRTCSWQLAAAYSWFDLQTA